MKYIDIHCHLNFPEYDADREAVIARAKDADIGMVIVGNDRQTSEAAVILAEKNENIWAVIGLHPVHVSSEDDFDYSFFKRLAGHPKVVGIGECGLDYFRADPGTPGIADGQEKVFRAHIKLAHEMNKPLVLHIRDNKNKNPATSGSARTDAYGDAIKILQDERASRGHSVIGDVHFFAGGLDYARKFIELDFSLSFTGVVTFAKEYREVIRNIPLDRIMSETDSPFVAPAPFRGQRNEPLHVMQVADAIAAARSEDRETVIAQLVTNARTLFKI